MHMCVYKKNRMSHLIIVHAMHNPHEKNQRNIHPKEEGRCKNLYGWMNSCSIEKEMIIVKLYIDIDRDMKDLLTLGGGGGGYN